MLNETTECCDICSEPLGPEHIDIGGKWICLVCTEEIVGQVTANARKELTFMNAAWRLRMARLSMN